MVFAVVTFTTTRDDIPPCVQTEVFLVHGYEVILRKRREADLFTTETAPRVEELQQLLLLLLLRTERLEASLRVVELPDIL